MDGNTDRLKQDNSPIEGNTNVSGGNVEVSDPLPNATTPAENLPLEENASHWQQDTKQKRISAFQIIGWLIMVIIGVAALLLFLNREWIHDYLRGREYQPTGFPVRSG